VTWKTLIASSIADVSSGALTWRRNFPRSRINMISHLCILFAGFFSTSQPAVRCLSSRQ
jgi:hypothetical protein